MCDRCAENPAHYALLNPNSFDVKAECGRASTENRTISARGQASGPGPLGLAGEGCERRWPDGPGFIQMG